MKWNEAEVQTQTAALAEWSVACLQLAQLAKVS